MLRGAGEVGCAHCKKIGADRACQICTRLVCATCAANWATCDEPSGRVVRLGTTARVRDIDPLGRYALVSHWRKPLRVLDLRALRWLAGVDLPRALYIWARAFPPRLTSDARLIHAELAYAASDDGFDFVGIRARSLHGGQIAILDSGGRPDHATGVSAVGDRYYYVNTEQRVVVVDTTCRLYEPLPRKVVQAVHVDGERALLASGSWSELALHRMVDGRLERLGHTATEQPGDVRWIGIAGPYLAASVQTDRGAHIEVRELDDSQGIGDVVHRHGPARAFTTAALSRDGRHLAFAYGKTLHVLALDTGEHFTFDDHTDDVNAMRFASDDHVLISADSDNRVALRPRTTAGYARALLSISVDDA